MRTGANEFATFLGESLALSSYFSRMYLFPDQMMAKMKRVIGSQLGQNAERFVQYFIIVKSWIVIYDEGIPWCECEAHMKSLGHSHLEICRIAGMLNKWKKSQGILIAF
jgi:hypothetical protein